MDDIDIRDWFAAQALSGYLAAHADGNTALPAKWDIAGYAYGLADAMLAARRPKPAPAVPVAEPGNADGEIG